MLTNQIAIPSPCKSRTESLKEEALKMLEPFNLTQSMIEYFSSHFKIMNMLGKPRSPPKLLPAAIPSVPIKSKTLVLDLDETLVHADSEFDECPASENTSHFRIRPGLEKFLKQASEQFELIIFTAATEKHAKGLIEAIDPKKQYFSGVLYRQSCTCIKGHYIKDLRILGKYRQLKNVIAIDDSLLSISFNLDNGIIIRPYMGENEDDELEDLWSVLESIVGQPDLSLELARTFRLRMLKGILDLLYSISST